MDWGAGFGGFTAWAISTFGTLLFPLLRRPLRSSHLLQSSNSVCSNGTYRVNWPDYYDYWCFLLKVLVNLATGAFAYGTISG